MRYVNVSLLALAIFLYAGLPAWGREYKPVTRPALSVPVHVPKSQAAPKEPKQQPRQPIITKPVKIPKFNTPENNSTPEQQPVAEAPSSSKLFGTVEFRRPLESLPGWLDVLKRNSNDPIFIPEKLFNKSVTWEALRAQAQPLEIMDQLRVVNRFWNGWPYREDSVNWGKPDYWAIPAQFLIKSGDCEDYAIAKYFTLKELGVDPASMRIVVLRDTVRNLAHAVLAVYLNGDIYILDNLSNVVLSHRRLANYSPQFSINEFGRWTHIKGKPIK